MIMIPIAHFLLSVIGGLGVGIHIENKIRKYSLILLLALAATSIDLDHLLPIYQETGIKVLHNFFIFVLFPVALLLSFIVYERKRKSSIRQRSCLILCIMMVGHMFQDIISGGGAPILYPLRSDIFVAAEVGITLQPSVLTLASWQVMLIIWGVIICIANFYETLTFKDVEGRKPSDSWVKGYRADKKSRKSWLPAVINGISLRKSRDFLAPKTFGKVYYENEEKYSEDEDTTYLLSIADGLLN